MKKSPELSLILPCFNETEHFELSINKIVESLQAQDIDFEIIFVEDKSIDNTREFVQKFIKDHRDLNLSAIYHLRNIGRGKSVSDGIKQAKGLYCGFIDIDCEISPSYIPEFLKTLRMGADMVVAQRFYKITPANLLRALMSRIYSLLVKFVLNTRIHDTEAGYKFWRTHKIKNILSKVYDPKWFWDTEVSVRSEQAGFNIVSIPVLFERRTDKSSTVRVVRDSVDYLFKLREFRKQLNKNT